MSTGLLTLLSLPAHSFLVPTDHVWFVKCRQKTGDICVRLCHLLRYTYFLLIVSICISTACFMAVTLCMYLRACNIDIIFLAKIWHVFLQLVGYHLIRCVSVFLFRLADSIIPMSFGVHRLSWHAATCKPASNCHLYLFHECNLVINMLQVKTLSDPGLAADWLPEEVIGALSDYSDYSLRLVETPHGAVNRRLLCMLHQIILL